MSQKQKQFFLQEQLKTIKRELGMEKDEKEVCDTWLVRLIVCTGTCEEAARTDGKADNPTGFEETD